jgi:hypothetical protein
MSTSWLILNKYPFELIPGEGRNMESGGVSYYDYINKRPTETGKNVQCVAHLMSSIPKGLILHEPFGGVGVFAIAAQEILNPKVHFVDEIDETCLKQLNYTLRDYPVSIGNEDAREALGRDPSDVYLCDFPLFSFSRYMAGRWEPELARMTAQKPKFIIMTDGSSCRYHFGWKRYNKFDSRIDDTKQSYVYSMSRLFWERYEYSITACAYHANSFYYRLEPKAPYEIEFTHFPAGTAKNGLKRVI